MYAPTQLQGSIAEVDGKLVHVNNEQDLAFAQLPQRQVPIYPSISMESSLSTQRADHIDSFITELLKNTSDIISLLPQSLQDAIKNSVPSRYAKALYETVVSNFFSQQPLPTLHHLFSANAPPVRAVAWHPHHELLAIAREDHHVYIYERDSQRNTWRTQVLEHHYMANITSLEWKKYSHGTLAVGCQAGVCVWFLTDSRCANRFDFVPATERCELVSTTDKNQGDNRTLSNAYMHFFSTPGHRHISSVAWDPSPGSQVLAAASGVDSTLIMYDIMTFNHTPVKRYGKGNTLLSWSPDGKYLYVANLNGKSRLWETRNWTNTEIRNPPGLWVKSACWAPDSCSLFYSMVGKQDIHALCLPTSKSTASGMWDIKILEIPPAEVTMSNEQKVPIGGVIKELALDPNNGCRLAVSFEHCNYVALYKVMPLKQPMSLSQGQELTLIGYTRGMEVSTSQNNELTAEPMENTKPTHIHFVKSFTEGALLATTWKNNRISFVTMDTA